MERLMGLELNGVEKEHLRQVVYVLVKDGWKEYSHLYNSLEEAFAYEEEGIQEALDDMVNNGMPGIRKEYFENLQQYLASIKKIML